MAESLRELSTTKPESIDGHRITGVSELTVKMSEAEPRGRIHQVASKGAGSRSQSLKCLGDGEIVRQSLCQAGIAGRLLCPMPQRRTAGDARKRGELHGANPDLQR